MGVVIMAGDRKDCRFLLSVLTERGTNDVFCYAVSIDTNNRFLVHYGQERNGKLF